MYLRSHGSRNERGVCGEGGREGGREKTGLLACQTSMFLDTLVQVDLQADSAAANWPARKAKRKVLFLGPTNLRSKRAEAPTTPMSTSRSTNPLQQIVPIYRDKRRAKRPEHRKKQSCTIIIQSSSSMIDTSCRANLFFSFSSHFHFHLFFSFPPSRERPTDDRG